MYMLESVPLQWRIQVRNMRVVESDDEPNC